MSVQSASSIRLNSIFRSLSAGAQIADLSDLSNETFGSRNLTIEFRATSEIELPTNDTGSRTGLIALDFVSADEAFSNAESWLI